MGKAEMKPMKGQNASMVVNGNTLHIEVDLTGERWESNGPAKSQMVATGNATYEYMGKNCVINLNSYEKNTKANIMGQNADLLAKIAELEAAAKA